MKTFCISLGGSIVSGEDGVNVEYIKKLGEMLSKHRKDKRFVIVVGGGYVNKVYIDAAKKVIKNNSVLDEIGIAFTRINALFLKDMLSEYLKVYSNIITSIDELKMVMGNNEVSVLGGLLPGITTDSTCVLACEAVGSKELINVSRVPYIYDRPPSEEGAEVLEELSHDKMIELAYKYDSRGARENFIFDLVASKLAKRSNIKVSFVNDNIDELEKVILGERHKGSIIIN